MEKDAINWNLRFICQKREKKDKCRSTKDGHKHLSTILPEFQKKNDGLPFCLDKLKGNYDILENALIKREAKYHKCYNDYSEEKLKRAKERQNKSNVVSDTTEQLRGLFQSTRSRDTSANSFIVFVPKQTQKTILEQQVHFMQQKIKLI